MTGTLHCDLPFVCFPCREPLTGREKNSLQHGRTLIVKIVQVYQDVLKSRSFLMTFKINYQGKQLKQSPSIGYLQYKSVKKSFKKIFRFLLITMARTFYIFLIYLYINLFYWNIFQDYMFITFHYSLINCSVSFDKKISLYC